LELEKRTRKDNKYQKQKRDRLFLSKITIVGVLLVLQIAFFVYTTWWLGEYQEYLQIACTILSVLVVIYIVNKKENPAYKLAWSVLILIFPLFGGLFYLIVAGNRSSKRFIRKIQKSIADSCQLLPQNPEVVEQLKSESESVSMQSEYIQKYGPYPVYQGTKLTYYPLGDDNMEPLLEELRKAKRFIFMEYFIIREGVFWNSVLEILEQKVAEGVDVRVLFDDFGCVATIPANYEQQLRAKGIPCYSFNRFIPVLTLRLNNRDHRKITVIDGHTGFTGGVNLSDEYINLTHPYGHWKDTGIMLQGEAVWSMTVMFLQMWDYVVGIQEDFWKYAPLEEDIRDIEDDGFVQPYSDSPLDDEIVGENIYLNMINRAKRSISIITPYLVLDNEMLTALSLAAKSGVDVKIIIPGVPDKKVVYTLTKSYAEMLLEEGIHVYQYTPGFTHAKVMIADGEVATVGTVNMDFRSLYLHFECGVWMYRSRATRDIRDDFEETLTKCHEMTLDECRRINWIQRLWRALLRLIAPLL
jgi:cardiolipin synthase